MELFFRSMPFDHLFTCFDGVPGIPQLHESILGLHIKSSDIDDGSFNGSLVCSTGDRPGSISSVHPSITFDEPITSLEVVASGASRGDVVWDATYSLGGKPELPRDLPAVAGNVPSWLKICTPKGELENYTIEMKAVGAKSGPFQTTLSFTSANDTSVALPDKSMPLRLPGPQPSNPDPPPYLSIRPDDFNPRRFIDLY